MNFGVSYHPIQDYLFNPDCIKWTIQAIYIYINKYAQSQVDRVKYNGNGLIILMGK